MALSVEASYVWCERVARRAARNFYYGFLLLPRPKRLALCALYAYMRRVDDLADSPGDLDNKKRLLAGWRERTDKALAGDREGEPLWPALADT
ncbi:MAG: squalene/phytoene synthase family protein, partial [Acidobacteriota bacterium]|nr:squalene/phytoene synthase family protein [Acidobacteriota bacterium]